MSKDTRGTVKAKTYSVPRSAMYNAPDGDYYYLTVVELADYMALATKLDIAEFACAAMAAENAKLKKFCKDAAFDADYEAEPGMERGGFSDALNEIKTTATDAFLAEVRAQGVEMAAKSDQFSTWVQHGLRSFAIGVRQGDECGELLKPESAQ